MFEQILTGRVHHMEPREAFLALLSLFFHAAGIASLLAASWLSLTPIPLPKLREELVQPIFFPGAGAPAPKLGGGAAAASSSPKAEPNRQERQETPKDLVQPAAQAPEKPAASTHAPGEEANATLAAPAGPGVPEGSPDGEVGGVPGGNCVGEGCDPAGPVGNGSGAEGPPGADSEIHLPGVQQVTEPVIIASTKVLPIYPALAKHAGVEGRVILQAVVTSAGRVENVLVLKETPPRVGFGDAATEAVSRWRYQPATLRGVPVTVQLTITVDFTLSR